MNQNINPLFKKNKAMTLLMGKTMDNVLKYTAMGDIVRAYYNGGTLDTSKPKVSTKSVTSSNWNPLYCTDSGLHKLSTRYKVSTDDWTWVDLSIRRKMRPINTGQTTPDGVVVPKSGTCFYDEFVCYVELTHFYDAVNNIKFEIASSTGFIVFDDTIDWDTFISEVLPKNLVNMDATVNEVWSDHKNDMAELITKLNRILV